MFCCSPFSCTLAAITSFLVFGPTWARADDARPNIVYVLADDLGYGELGCYGQKKIHTPNLDRMASEGMRLTQHYAGAPVCAPSRCTLMTGLHTGHAYIRNNRDLRPEGQEPIPADTVTAATLLKQRGYATAAIGKWGLGTSANSGDPNRHGFDHFFGFYCQRHAHNHYPTYLWRNGTKVPLDGNSGGATGKQYAQDLFTEEALAFIKDHQKQPFFLYLPVTIPHLAIQVPEDSLAEYRGKWPDPPYKGGKGYQPHPAPRAGYAAMITRMDRDVGRILALLKALGLDDNTLVLFSSDNGPTHAIEAGADTKFFHSAGPLNGLKGSVYEGGLRVPLIAHWPGKIKAGMTSDHVSAFWDVLPTLAEVAGAKTPPGLDGISFLPTLLGADGQKTHDALYWEFYGYSGQQAIRMGDWKGVRQNCHKNPNGPLRLYDLKRDPGEQHDVVAEHPEIVERLEQRMRKEHTDSPLWSFGRSKTAR
jgi:arylsulfatase A